MQDICTKGAIIISTDQVGDILISLLIGAAFVFLLKRGRE